MKTSRRRFQITKENKGTVAIELLTVLLLIDLAFVCGRFVRSGGYRTEWTFALIAIAAVLMLFVVGHAVAEIETGRAIRLRVIAMEWLFVRMADRLRLLHVFPLSVLTVVWFRLVAREAHLPEYRLRHPRLGTLITQLRQRDVPSVQSTVSNFIEHPRSLTEYLVAVNVETIASAAIRSPAQPTS
jgi:hypothetical protein